MRWNRQGTVLKLGKEAFGLVLFCFILFFCIVCKSVLKFLATACCVCCMGIKSFWTKLEKEVGKNRRQKKRGDKQRYYLWIRKLLSADCGKYEGFWGEWQRIFVYDCSKHLLLAAPGDRVIGQAGCFVWVDFVISVGLNSQSDPLWWFLHTIL